MLTRIPNPISPGLYPKGRASHPIPFDFRNQKTKVLHASHETPSRKTEKECGEGWHTIPLNLPTDVEAALSVKQRNRQPETPNEKALYAIAKELRNQIYCVILCLPAQLKDACSDNDFRKIPRLLIGQKIQATLKWQIEPYQPEEQPEFYAETDYYLDEACLEIWVCGIRVESTLCMANFLAKMRELKKLNPDLFNQKSNS